ncbi:MAG: hypothetical protein OXM03_04445 [Chloroflexota bacterium]|nr:hypothetical protein [Caldilineaceae bacterium]MDE0455172.1 hypothetical protein [Gammaproteobacteria bacterium]MDE2839858.1 hypothetical protein [Chloroflexota bacterium]
MTDAEQKIKVWWIDDDHANVKGRREAERDALESQTNQALNLVPIHPADFGEYLLGLSKESRPDLLLIDFRLHHYPHQDPEKKTPFFARDGVTLRGTTLGDRILKDVPAYLVSRVTREAQIGSSDEYFDWVLSHDQLIDDDGGMLLLADAADYRELRERDIAASRSNDPDEIQQVLVDAICEILRVPKTSLGSVQSLVSQKIQTLLRSELNLDSDEIRLAPSRPRAIARWVRTALQRLSGPLIDNLRAATMFGTTVDYFRTQIEPKLDLVAVKYSGIFCATARMTFWRLALMQSLLRQAETIEFSSPASLARTAAEHFKVPEKDRSICRVCRKPWPEAIAFDEDDPRVEAPVHWRCSKEATEIDSVIGFDIPRSFGE